MALPDKKSEAITCLYRDQITSNAGRFSVHSQDYFEIYSFISGEGPFFYYIGDTMYEIIPGDVLILRPRVLHGGYKKVKARYRRMYVSLPVSLFDYIRTFDPALAGFFTDGKLSIVTPAGEDAERYARLTEELRALKAERRKYNQTLILSRLLEQLVILARTAGKGEASAPPSSDNELIRRVVAYIDSEYASIGSADEIAERFSYSRNYLAHYFKSHMNIGLHEFLTEKKLAEATAQLIAGKEVGECAFSCGFGSASYFISLFKKRRGMTPAQYVKKLKQS